MRFLPEQTVVCHVCGSSYTVKSHLDAASGTVVSEPSTCPACGVVRRTAPARSPGLAKSLVLTFAGVRWYVERFGDAARFLEQHSLRAEDVDAYLGLVDGIDFAAWEADERAVKKPTADERETLALLPRLRAEAAGGQLRAALANIAEPVKSKLRAEQAQHLEVFRQRTTKQEPSMDWKHGTPVKWSEYLAEDSVREAARRDLLKLKEVSPLEKAMPGTQLGEKTYAASDSIVRFGPDETRAMLSELVPLLPLALEQLRVIFPANPRESMPFLQLLSAMECCGVPLPAPMAGAPVDEWLGMFAAKLGMIGDHERIGLALTCLAFGRPDAIPKILKRKKTKQYKPGWEFYDLWPEFVEYMALALEKGASAEDVRPAFHSIVWAFPTLNNKQLAWWPDLLLAARVYYGLFEKRPVGEVGQALYDLVRTM
jgi:hypothetical protein